MTIIGTQAWDGGVLPGLTYDDEVAADSPIFYYKQDDSDDNIPAPLIDSSGNGNDGQVINPSPGVAKAPLHAGSIQSLYAVVATSLPLMESSLGVIPLSGSFSVEAWADIQVLNAGDVIMSRWGGDSDFLFAVTQTDIGGGDFKARLSVRDAADAQFSVNSATSLIAGTSYYIVVTYSGSNGWNLYVDATDITNIPENRKVISDRTLRLNAYGDASDVSRGNAEYDSWALYGTELPQARIQAHWNAGQ